MRIASSASAALALLVLSAAAACAAEGQAAAEYGFVEGKPTLTLKLGGGDASLPIGVDATVDPSGEAGSVKVLAFVPDRYLVVVDTHASIPAGLSRCGAGEEAFLRVVAFPNGEPREALTVKLASCLDNIEVSGEAAVAADTLTVDWLTGPDGLKPASLAFSLAPKP